MNDNASIVDKLMEIFESKWADHEISNGPEHCDCFERKMYDKYDTLANAVRSLAFEVEDPKPEKCSCQVTTYRGTVGTKGLVCDNCGGEYDYEMYGQPTQPDPLPRKEVISIQPGDKIVLSIEYTLTQKAHERIKETLELEFPNTECLILDGGATLEVYREQVKETVAPTGNPHLTR